MVKDFWNLPVNPVWRVPGFMKEGKADNEHSNPVLLPLVPEFTNICISHLQLLHFQKFLLEVVAIGRKNESDKLSRFQWLVYLMPLPFKFPPPTLSPEVGMTMQKGHKKNATVFAKP